LSNGAGALRVRTTDLAGNITNGAVTQNYTIDTTKPTTATSLATAVINPNNSVQISGDESITLTFSEAIDVDTLIQDEKFAFGALSTAHEAKLGTSYSVTANGAVDGVATSFTITLSGDATLVTSGTLVFAKSKIVDTAGNSSASNLTFTIPADILYAVPDGTTPVTMLTTDVDRVSTNYLVGDVLTIKFSENVRVADLVSGTQFAGSVLTGTGSANLGAYAVAAVTPSDDGYATEFAITLGSGATLAASQTLIFAAYSETGLSEQNSTTYGSRCLANS
jgi:hypothetical protein